MTTKLDLLLGKIALDKGYVTRSQLDDSIAAQERAQRESGIPKPLGEIMLAQGIIDQAALQELLELQQEKFRQALELSQTRREDGIFGQILIQRKLVPPERVNECLRIQAQMAERDIHMRLGEVLVKKGYLTSNQVREVLLLQRKVIMACPACKKNYNVPGRKDGVVVRCPKCSTDLRPLDLGQTISAADTAFPESADRPQPIRAVRKGMGDFGRYELLEEIGEGGMGVVYKAWDTELRRLVALKMLKGEESQPQQVERFRREARAAAKLRHPNIVHIHDVGTVGDKHYFTMDFVEGGSLREQMQLESGRAALRGILRTGGPEKSQPQIAKGPTNQAKKQTRQRIPLRKGLETLRDIAFALEHAHAHGIIHRDIKPANILVDGSGAPFLTDFGLAKDFKDAEKSGLTVDGQVIGTPYYLSPELAAGDQKKLGPASDTYSLGVIMFELLTRKRPFEADSFLALVWKIMHEDAPAPRSLASRVHKDLETICLKAIEKEPERRYRSAREFGEDIRRYLDGEPIAARPISLAHRLLRKWTKNRAAFWASVSALAMALAAGIFVAVNVARRASELEAKGRAEEERDKTRLELAAEAEAKRTALAAEAEAKRATEQERNKAQAAAAAEAVAERVKGLNSYLYSTTLPMEEYWEAIDQCFAEFDDLVNRHPAAAQVWYYRGRLMLMLSRYQDAENELTKALELEPGHYMARLYRARLYAEWYLSLLYNRPERMEERHTEREDKWKKALADISALRGTEGGTRRTEEEERARALVEASEAIADGKPDRAIEILAKAGGERPHEEFLNLTGFAWLEKGDVEKAKKLQAKALERRPRYWKAYFDRGCARRKKDDLDGAIEDYNQAVKMNPKYAEAYASRADAHFQKGDVDGAIDDFTEALKIDPRHAAAYINRGAAHYTKGDFDGAIADYTEALKIDPRFAEVYSNRGAARHRKGDLDGAIADYTEALKTNPQYAGAYYNRGAARYKKGDLDGAIADYTELLKIDPRYAKAYNNRGVARKDKGDLDAAIADYDEALKIDPQYAEAYYNRGIARKNRRDLDGAIADYTEALKIIPRYAEAYFNRGLARADQGDFDGAIADMEKALEVATPNWPYRRMVEQNLEKLRESKK